MYKFVTNKFDVVYLSKIPENYQFQKGDIPEEESELREIVEVWYECSFLPTFNLLNIDIANKADLTAVQIQTLGNDTSTLAFLLKNGVYRAALNRMLSVWTLELSAKMLLEQVLFELSIDKKRSH
jgi:hypothetical protein